MKIRHLRRPQAGSEGGYSVIRCDCGWKGQTPMLGRTRPQIAASLDQLFRDHLPAAERRTHLLVDTREPDDNLTLEELRLQMPDDQARAAYAAQPKIVGTFVMPEGTPAQLLADRVEDGVHFGRFVTADGTEGELPIGEVFTAEGRVFRLSE